MYDRLHKNASPHFLDRLETDPISPLPIPRAMTLSPRTPCGITNKHIFRSRCIMSFMASGFQMIIFFGDSTRGPRGISFSNVNKFFNLNKILKVNKIVHWINFEFKFFKIVIFKKCNFRKFEFSKNCQIVFSNRFGFIFNQNRSKSYLETVKIA